MKFDTSYAGDGTMCTWCNEREHGPCQECGGTGRGPVARARFEWLDYALADETGEYTVDQAARDAERLARCFSGWLHVYGRDSSRDWRVVAPELKLAVPIHGPTGSRFTPTMWVVEEADGMRIARTGEAHLPNAKRVRWPWFQVLTLDALMRHRHTDALAVYECKTANSPERRLQSVSVDPQVAGYVWAAGVAVRAGLVPGVDQSTPVTGYIYDVLSSANQSDPKLLAPQKVKALAADGKPYKVRGRWVYVLGDDEKPIERSPGLSRNEKAGVPSWRYRAAIEAHGFDVTDYEDHLLNLMVTVDRRLYVREEATSGSDVSGRYVRELYTVARQLASHRRRAAELRQTHERDSAFPRQAVCISGYGCAYRSLCLQDGELIRRNFVQAEPVRWVDSDTDQTDKNMQEDLGW